MGGAEFGEFLVLDFDDLAAEVAVLAVPERIDGQHFHIDALGVHGPEPGFNLDEGLRRSIDGRNQY
jgi:hypothetical protein